MKFALKFFRKWSFFDQYQQPRNSVEPFERILRTLFISQCPYKLSGSDCFHVISDCFDSFFGICMLFEIGPPRNLLSWVKYYGTFESFGKEFRRTKFIAVEDPSPVERVKAEVHFYQTSEKQRQKRKRQEHTHRFKDRIPVIQQKWNDWDKLEQRWSKTQKRQL